MLLKSPLPHSPFFDVDQTHLSSGSDTFFDAPTPSRPLSFQSRLDSLYGPNASHSPITNTNTRTSTSTSTITHLSPASQPLIDRSSINNVPLHDLVEAINLSTPKKSSDLTNDSDLQTAHLPASPTTPTPIPKDLPKTPCIIPVHLQKANLTVSDRIQSEKKSPHHDFHEQRIERELQTPSPEPIIHAPSANDKDETSSQDASSVRDDLDTSTQDAFWGASTKENSTDLLNNNEPALPASTSSEIQKPDSSEPFSYPSHSLPGAVYQESDIESVTSRSTFSEESLPAIVAPPIVLPCNVDEVGLFDSLFHVLDDAFSDFEARWRESFEPLPSQKMVLRLPSFHASQVFYGLRPDYSGCWTGFIHLNGRYSSLSKLLDVDFEDGFIYGVEVGGIRKLDGYGDAIVFMEQDRKVYYTSREGWFEEDDEGFYGYEVHGGFEMRQFRMSAILDL
jgi:hypothetical protein